MLETVNDIIEEMSRVSNNIEAVKNTVAGGIEEGDPEERRLRNALHDYQNQMFALQQRLIDWTPEWNATERINFRSELILNIAEVREGIEAAAKAMASGNSLQHKQGDWAWKKTTQDHIDGATRHLKRMGLGETLDADSKLPPLYHVAARILMAITLEERKKGG